MSDSEEYAQRLQKVDRTAEVGACGASRESQGEQKGMHGATGH